ncbi:hypothetical protein, partial [Actinophytocola sp.]|uniref:hypothetical protein n=1 Tax=Actinophytocola sp. TaxID=1872138 RepID=UPI0025C5B2B0
LPLIQVRQDRPELRRQDLLIDLHDHGHTRTMTEQSRHVQVNLRQFLRGSGEDDDALVTATVM